MDVSVPPEHTTTQAFCRESDMPPSDSDRSCDQRASEYGRSAKIRDRCRGTELRSGFRHCSRGWRHLRSIFSLVILVALLFQTADAVFINFDNCLDPNIRNSNPLQLQFIPLHFWAKFNTSEPRYHLNVTVYGNISGIATAEALPGPDDPQWQNPNKTKGKIVDLSTENNAYTTFFSKFNVLSYTPYEAQPSRFCNASVHGECPLIPAFYANSSDVSELPAFSVAHDFSSSYGFTTMVATLRVVSGNSNSADLACVSASITPELGSTVRALLRYLPLVVLIFVGVATIVGAVFSPWGTSDIFRWTTNMGRDEDILRLVTPGFADCLHYIQFMVLTGSLSLNYPGFFQPVLSQVSWSVLLFNESFVSHGGGTQSHLDGVYAVNGTYGLDRLGQLVGMDSVKDIWAGMTVWILVILAAVIVIIQVSFTLRWLHYMISDISEEDLRARNFPFTAGNAIRITFNYFLLPLVSLSTFQIVIAGKSPASIVGCAVLLLIILFALAGWFFYVIGKTRPRSFLFDDQPTLLLYGSLYNTYSDEAANFALVPIFLNITRGIAIGAVQPSGIAQIVLLAICEVIQTLTINAFRPYPSSTSMNAYQTSFSVVRMLTIMLSIGFIPSLGVTEAPRGWMGYVVLLLHAIVLVFGFFLNAVQTLVEVGARMTGAGGDGARAARGPLGKAFGVRQLSRRQAQQDPTIRHSMTSDAAILGNEVDKKSLQLDGGRVRSFSGSSALLLKGSAASEGRASTILDSGSAHGLGHNRTSGSGPYTPTTPGTGSAFSYGPAATQPPVARGGSPGAILGIQQADHSDPYYRPPRPRRATTDPTDLTSPPGTGMSSWSSTQRTSRIAPDSEDPLEGPSAAGGETLSAAHLGAPKDDLDFTSASPGRAKTDYAVREVDFYYGVRGPALSSTPTRRLKTGPADPDGPVSSATGWFRGLFGGKSKDKGKGFEVVRSSRAPPPGMMQEFDPPQSSREPYRDNPDTSNGEEAAVDGSDEDYEPDVQRESQLSPIPPSLPQIDSGGGIELPSRIGSKASKQSKGSVRSKVPSVPRKSSKRQSSGAGEISRLSAIAGSPPGSPQAPRKLYNPDDTRQRHLLPSAAGPGRLPFGSGTSPPKGSRQSIGGESVSSSLAELAGEDGAPMVHPSHARHSSSALGGLAPDIRDDRPASVGYVQQHRASDNIHESSPDSPPLLGSTAEFVGDPSRRSFGGVP